MTIKELMVDISIKKWIGHQHNDILQIAADSRRIKLGSLFIAIKGTQVDGHKFIDKAIQNGAVAVVLEELPQALQQDVVYIQVEDSATSLGQIASRFYGKPSQQLQVIGVTGTNGKTTTTTLLFDLFSKMGYKCGLISTISIKIGLDVLPATHTTPDALALNQALAHMVEAGCDFVFMEVSSHAIHQKRIAGVVFAGGIFTNLTHDHLDYHGTFKAYLNAKKAFFDQLPKGAFALSNLDDKNGSVMVQNTKADIHFYSLRSMASFKGRLIENSLQGLHLEFNGLEFFSSLIGNFNAYNLLAVYGAAILLQQESEQVLVALSALQAAAGRFDYVNLANTQITGIVDYAHTPDALQNVLKTINQAKPNKSKIYTVVGCGGDRDKEKRPKMATIAASMSYKAILTSDNPRSEDPATIIQDMVTGLDQNLLNRIIMLVNRREAIQLACQLANERDIILVAGKGHETYQEINGIKHPFDDKVELKKALQA